jgi:hypothetical protein
MRIFVLLVQRTGRYEERYPATLRGEPPSRVKVLERMRVERQAPQCCYSSGTKVMLTRRLKGRPAGNGAITQLATNVGLSGPEARVTDEAQQAETN